MLHCSLCCWRKVPRAKESRRPLEPEGAGSGFVPRASGGTSPADTLISGLLTCRAAGGRIREALSVYGTVMVATGAAVSGKMRPSCGARSGCPSRVLGVLGAPGGTGTQTAAPRAELSPLRPRSEGHLPALGRTACWFHGAVSR